MSSPELESFKMNEDEIQDMYDPLRKKKKPSKNYNLYGVWADSSDEEDKGYKKGKLLKDYTKPVNFISGGVKVGDKINNKDEKKDDVSLQDSDEEEEEEIRPTIIKRKSAVAKDSIVKSSGFGDWEKHNKGIGSKLMRMMGHQAGQGLGKKSQGIVKPIEAFMRKGRGAVGMYGSESIKVEEDVKTSKKRLDSDEEEDKEFRKKMQRWKKGESVSKTKFYTADDLLNSKEAKSKLLEKSTKANDSSQIKIIDMTGKEKRILSGYHALSTKKVDEEATVVEKYFDHPELVHNLELLVNMAEDDIIQNTKRLNYEQDSLINLQMELERLDNICKQDEVDISKLESIIKIIDQISEITNEIHTFSDTFLFDKLFSLIKNIKNDYPEEFHLHELSDEIALALEPLISKLYKNWNPLQKSDYGLETMAKMKNALTISNQVFALDSVDQTKAFDKLMWQIIVPCIRDSVRGWDVRQPNQMLVLIEKWVSLMHQSMVSSLMDQFVFSKLQMEIAAWDPLTDPIPIHSWVQPWLFLMKDRIASFYPTIRLKLGNALAQWHPSDPSAKLILEPWVNVFETNQLDIFLVKFILPKLAFSLQQMEINPNNQSFETWGWIMEWVELIPQNAMASLIADHFLPRWFNVLSSWVSSNNANSQEITEWYFGWKQRIPPRLINNPIIKNCLKEGMLLIQQKIHNPPGPHPVAFRQNFSEFLEAKRNIEEPIGKSMKFMSIKERLDHECQQKGIMFLPVSNKMHDGKQIYKIGRNNLVYFERRIMFYLEDGRWKPTSNIENLLSRLLP